MQQTASLHRVSSWWSGTYECNTQLELGGGLRDAASWLLQLNFLLSRYSISATMKNKWKTKHFSKLRPSQLSKAGSSNDSRHRNIPSYENVSWSFSSDMWKILAVCSVASFGLYINTIWADFAYDDSRAIVKNQDLRPETPISHIWYDDFWGTPLQHSGSHKSYRPLVVLSFRLNYAIHQLSPGGYHLFNTFLHAISSILYTATIALVIRQRLVTAVAGVLFAIHPIHTEAVAGIVGRADVLCSIFFLLSILTFIRYCELKTLQKRRRFLWIVLTFALVTASTLSKELGITALGVCAVYYLFFHRRIWLSELLDAAKARQLAETMGLLISFGAVLLGLRLLFMGNSLPSFSPADNPAANSDSILTRTLTFFFLPVFCFVLLLCPVKQSFDWSMGAIPLVETIWDIRVLISLVFYGLLVWTAKYSLEYFHQVNETGAVKPPPSPKCHRNEFSDSNGHTGNSISFIARNGSMNGVETATYRRCRRYSSSSAESSSCDENQNEIGGNTTPNFHRHHATLLLGLSMMILPFLPASNLFFYVGFVVAERVLYIPSMGFCLLVAEAFYQLYKKARDHATGKTFFYATLVVLALLLSLRTYTRCLDWRSEELLYKSGISVNPAKAWGNLANILNNRGDIKGAETAYRSALSHRGNMADVHYNLGILLQNQNRNGEALEEYNMAIQCRPRLTVAYLNKGIVLALMGNHLEAIKVYYDCTKIDTSGLKDPRMHETAKISALYNLGRLYAEREDYQSAIGVYKLALERRPEYYPPPSIYNLMGEAYFHSGDLNNAEKAYRMSLESKPDHLPAHLTMARLMNVKKQHNQAEEWYQKALRIDDKDTQNYHHYALFLAEHGRHNDALSAWQRAVLLSPKDFDVVFNLASALRQAGRSREALEHYEKAVTLAPQSATAHMNLGAMYHINKNYALAEKSYVKALKINPSDQVTKNNLKKLQNIMNKAKS